MKTAEKVLWFAVAALAGGCGYSTQGYRYQHVSASSREFNCPLEVLSTAPKGRSNEELGFVEFKARRLGGLPGTQEEALVQAQSFACAAGGNALLVRRDGAGRYSRATILRVERR